jgi:hypothetical protein
MTDGSAAAPGVSDMTSQPLPPGPPPPGPLRLRAVVFESADTLVEHGCCSAFIARHEAFG